MTQRQTRQTRDSRVEFRTIKVLTNLNEQMQDLGKSINVYNTDPNVKNPFVQNNSPAQAPSQAPAVPDPAPNETAADE